MPSALKRDHPALQNKKFLTCFIFFGVIFAILDPYHGYGFPDVIESGSNMDLDPKHCKNTINQKEWHVATKRFNFLSLFR
jgi:hypothetical protein